MRGVDPGPERSGRSGARGRWVWLWVALVVAGSAGDARTQIEQTVELESATIEIDSPWPGNLMAGWFPVTVRATSVQSEPMSLSFRVSELYGSGSVSTGSIRLEPGETRTVSWLIPVHPMNTRTSYQLTVEGPDNDGGFVGLQSPKNAEVIDDTFTLVSRGVAGSRGFHAAVISHDRLPTDWRAYTSLGRLVLETEDGVPRAEVLEAIRAWVAVGGVLQVVGPTEALGFPIEARFDSGGGTGRAELRDDGYVSRGRPSDDLLWEQRYGFGSVQSVKQMRADLTLNWNAVIGARTGEHVNAVGGGVFPHALTSLWTPIPGLSALPVGWLTGILVLFYLVMGPMQFTWLKRRGAPPSRLLISTPVLGLGFAVLLLVASLLAQGLGVKQSVSSITWLDQQRHHVSVLAKRTVYSGSVFDSALHYGAGSAVANQARLQHGQTYLVDLDRAVLAGAFLPVRTPTDELLVRSATARQRVAIEREGDVLYAVSAFETDLMDFWYRDEAGVYFRAVEGVPAGDRVALSPATSASEVLSLGMQHIVTGATNDSNTGLQPTDSRLWPPLGHLPSELPLRCYAAFMEESPFLDDGGVPRDTVAQRHLLVGVLEPLP